MKENVIVRQDKIPTRGLLMGGYLLVDKARCIDINRASSAHNRC